MGDSFDTPYDFTSLIKGLLKINKATQLNSYMISFESEINNLM